MQSNALVVAAWPVAASDTNRPRSAGAWGAYHLEPLTRAYLGHHDVQPVTSTGDAPQYLTKLGAYVSKSAEALTADAFDHGNVAMHAIRALLREHAPGEAEMMQQLDLEALYSMAATRSASTCGAQMKCSMTWCGNITAEDGMKKRPGHF